MTLQETPVVSSNGSDTATSAANDASRPERRRAAPRLGEELPIFCERCGYSLHGLPQCRCASCTLLYFACPECNHRQPINTLRPAVQRVIGRVRAAFLILMVLFKLNWFGWLLFAWFAMGVEWSYVYNYRMVTVVGGQARPPTISHVPRSLDYESMLAFALFALPFGLFSRMLLLRWRRGLLVGLVLGAIVGVMVLAGAWFRRSFDSMREAPPLTVDFYVLVLIAAGCVALGAAAAWPVWVATAHAFLPARTANVLLEWQRSLATRDAAPNAWRGLQSPPNPA